MTPARIKRNARYIAWRATLLQWWLDALSATTTEPDLKEGLDRTWSNYDNDHPKWRPLYGAALDIVPAKDSVLNAEGKPTKLELVRKWSHEPGQIVESRSGARYMVREDHSLRRL